MLKQAKPVFVETVLGVFTPLGVSGGAFTSVVVPQAVLGFAFFLAAAQPDHHPPPAPFI